MDLFKSAKTEPTQERTSKSAAAYRTISEVADELGVATHVLRFWEGKFKQIQPLTRAGGRRYYTADDIAILRRIQSLLHDEGYTIKGVQTLLKNEKKQKTTILSPQELLTHLKSIRALLSV